MFFEFPVIRLQKLDQFHLSESSNIQQSNKKIIQEGKSAKKGFERIFVEYDLNQ